MQRAWVSLRTGNARLLAYSAAGASCAFLGHQHWQSRHRPILLDSKTKWQTRTGADDNDHSITSDETPLREQFKRAAQIQAGEVEDSNENQSNPPPPPQTKGHSLFNEEGDAPDVFQTAWQSASGKLVAVGESVSGLDLSGLKSAIIGFVVPGWLRELPELLTKLQNELSMAPWSLSWEIWEEAHDPVINPEILWDANVRISDQLCLEERDFLTKRKQHTAKALARYLGLSESEVHPEDVPTIALCGSGGGLRALVAGTSSYLSAHESGLFDCAAYTAGVSGSCWLQTLYYSSIGNLSHRSIIDHLKSRIGIHIASPTAALTLFNQAPTNKFLLSGFVEKLKGVPDSDFGLVDVYGLLLAARLMVPRGELDVDYYDLKVSNQKYYTEEGLQPLPIYTAVRHEIPDAPADFRSQAKEARFTTKHFDWFQWFEWTPYEFFCEELNAGIPTYAMGRRFEAGKTIWKENGLCLPELRVPLMLGIWGSAFCATLSHYYKEIRPIIKAAGFGKLDSVLSQKDEDLVKVHPVDPAVIPNFVLGLQDKLPAACPKSLHESAHLQLMDAGMSNNLPIYPLLRPGRDVDVIVAFDASADVRTDNWIKVVDGYVRQRNIKGWPMGAGWPPAGESTAEISQDMQLAEAAAVAHAPKTLDAAQSGHTTSMEELGPCTVWVGTKQEREEFMEDPPTKRLKHDASDDWHIREPDAGIALVYFPFLANEKVPNVDPTKSEFMSTWNFVYTPDEIDKVVQLARANFEEGQAQTKRVIKAVWERKKAARLRREKEELDIRRSARMQRGSAHRWRNADHGQGDQFGGV